jgi:hypothetical protein
VCPGRFSLRLGSGMPAPSGQIPPPWVWWENEAPATRAARRARFRLVPEVESALSGNGPPIGSWDLAPPSLNRPLGLHCLLYLVPDRICEPETAHPDGSIADALSASEHRLARVAGSAIKAFRWDPPPTAPDDLRIFVPCRPTLAVLKKELGPRLLMAALLECRDLGLVELRLGEERSWNRGRVEAVPLATLPLVGLCGEIIKRLARKGEQGIEKLFRGMMGNKPTIAIGGLVGERWVIDQVESELADRDYMRPTVMVRRWPAGRSGPSSTATRSRTWRRTAPWQLTDGTGPGPPTCRSIMPCLPTAPKPWSHRAAADGGAPAPTSSVRDLHRVFSQGTAWC